MNDLEKARLAAANKLNHLIALKIRNRAEGRYTQTALEVVDALELYHLETIKQTTIDVHLRPTDPR